MKNKNLITKIILILALIIITILSVLLVRYISLYKEASNHKFGYYLDSDMQITNYDLQNHNRIYEQFAVGKYDYNYIIKLLKYINNSNKENYENKYYQVNILFNGKEYNMSQDSDYNGLSEVISNEKGQYNADINYNELTGFINLVTIRGNNE